MSQLGQSFEAHMKARALGCEHGPKKMREVNAAPFTVLARLIFPRFLCESKVTAISWRLGMLLLEANCRFKGVFSLDSVACAVVPFEDWESASDECFGEKAFNHGPKAILLPSPFVSDFLF